MKGKRELSSKNFLHSSRFRTFYAPNKALAYLAVLSFFFLSSFTIFNLFSPITPSNAESPNTNTASSSTPAGTISLSSSTDVPINITPTPTQTIYSSNTTLNINNSCKKGATITLSTNKPHNNLERQGQDTLTKTISSVSGGGTLTDHTWGYSTNGTNYNPVPTKTSTPATIYSSTAATTTPTELNLTYAVKTDDTLPSGTYSTDLLYTVSVKPECLKYILKFDLNGGQSKLGQDHTDKQLSYGEKINLSTFLPTRENYAFAGWVIGEGNPADLPVSYSGTETNIDINPNNESELKLRAKWKYTKGLFSISNMQQMTSNICSKNTTPNITATQLDTDGSHHGDPNYVPTKTLTDTRDNNTYTVSKLADGKCWMTQNLRIAGKTLTPADSDVTTNYTIPASSISGFNAYDTSNAYVDSDGGFYNWYTATAGTGTQSLSTDGHDTTVSICPKGWKLPTSENNNNDFRFFYTKYSSSSALRSSPVNLTLSGRVYSSSRDDQGSDGYYWSSTVYSNNYAYRLYLNTSHINPVDLSNKYYGFSVRCVAR